MSVKYNILFLLSEKWAECAPSFFRTSRKFGTNCIMAEWISFILCPARQSNLIAFFSSSTSITLSGTYRRSYGSREPCADVNELWNAIKNTWCGVQGMDYIMPP